MAAIGPGVTPQRALATKTSRVQVGTPADWFCFFVCFFFDSLTALFALALLLGQPGLQLGLVGSQAVVHLLLLLQLQAQLGHAAVQLRTPAQPQGQSGLS